jgi:hypothetical protein
MATHIMISLFSFAAELLRAVLFPSPLNWVRWHFFSENFQISEISGISESFQKFLKKFTTFLNKIQKFCMQSRFFSSEVGSESPNALRQNKIERVRGMLQSGMVVP